MSKRNKEAPRKLIRGTYYLSKAGVDTDEVRSLILRRRLQILVHSCIYYSFNESIISDSTWSKWAMELASLQKQYPGIASRVDYAQEFEGFDGSTGFHLPLRNTEILDKAEYLLKLNKEEKHGNLRHQADRAESGSTVIRLLLP